MPHHLRIGPRPLPMHLATAATSWLGSLAALRSWSAASTDGSAPPPPPGAPGTIDDALTAALGAAGPAALTAAVELEVRRRLDRLHRGIEAYRRHPYRRDLKDPPTLWRRGAARLLDYGAEGPGDAIPLLFIPSLINGATILDLDARRSLLRWLARPPARGARALRPLLIDWGDPGAPGAEEYAFSVADYVTRRLDPALDAVIAAAGRPLVVGYCMGGTLAVALAARRAADIAGFAALAAPWNFHADGDVQARLLAAWSRVVTPAIDAAGALPVDLLQALFFALDPMLAARKFVRFADVNPRSAKARDFVALEDWLNDGAPLVAAVARECFQDWYGANKPALGRWLVDGAAIDPGRIDVPALVVTPANDRIVPPRSARALAEALPRAELLTPSLGHIGMIVGGGARAQVWRPVARWARRVG